MKRVVFFLAFLLIFSTAVWAQQAGTGQMPGQQGQMQHDRMGGGMQGDMKCSMMGEGQGMQMPMMQKMADHVMKMQEMLHMMKDMMKIQQRMLTTKISDSEKKQMSRELSLLEERIDKMLTDAQGMAPMKGMMGMPPAEPSKPAAGPKADDTKKSGQHIHH